MDSVDLTVWIRTCKARATNAGIEALSQALLCTEWTSYMQPKFPAPADADLATRLETMYQNQQALLKKTYAFQASLASLTKLSPVPPQALALAGEESEAGEEAGATETVLQTALCAGR